MAEAAESPSVTELLAGLSLASSDEGCRVGLVYDARMMAHEDPGGDHPEQPARLSSIHDRLLSLGLAARCIPVKAREATDEELEGVHTPQHVALMRSVSSKLNSMERNELARGLNSIYFNEGSSMSALLAAGSLVELAVNVASGKLSAGAAVIRPPGHHAEAHKAMGFCLFNNVAVAAHVLLHQQTSLGIKRLLIVDWDVHHGNGIQNMFWEDPQVLYFSVHRYNDGFFYPGGPDGDYDQVGGGKGVGFNINVPWPGGGFGDADYLTAWDNLLLPVAREFNPDLVLVSAGFDSAMGDPLGGCCLSPFGYSQMTNKLKELAGGRVVVALEGGYNLKAIAASYAACVAALLGDAPLTKWPPLTPRKASPSALEVISQARKALAPFWHGLRAKTDGNMDFHLVGQLPKRGRKSMSSPISETNGGQLEHGIPPKLGDVMLASAVEGDGSNPHPDSHSPIKDVVTPEEAESMNATHVWYASYGSNMLKERFLCYILGGRVDGMAYPCEGCRDRSLPLDDQWVEVPHRVWFGRKKTATWGEGGVSFLDPERSAHTSYMRLYKITLEQFNDIVAQENLRSSGSLVRVHHLRLQQLHSLRSSIDSRSNKFPTLEVLPDSWYGTIVFLGERDGAPVLSFTCSQQDVEKFYTGKFPVNAPSPTYHAVIARGLVEEKGLSEEGAHSYIMERARPLT